jgi:hypothetical protein
VGDVQFAAKNGVVNSGVKAFEVSHVMLLLLFAELRETDRK